MGQPILWALQLLWLLVVLPLSSPVLAATPVCVARDRNALLAFKAGLDDQNDQLASWTSTGNCCAFAGVTCNPSGEVVDFIFEAVIQDGCDDCPVIASKSGTTNNVNLIGNTLSKLLALQVLNLSNFILDDVTPTGLSALKSLTTLSLQNLNLHGPLAPDIGFITSLQHLRFSDGNRNISGPIPASFCRLTNLRSLILSESLLRVGAKSGAIPACISQLKQLVVLDLEYNEFSGIIPQSITQLTNLQSFKVTGNELSGSLPQINPEQLPALELLYLEGNSFVSSIPQSFGNLVSLMELRIGGLFDGTDTIPKVKIFGSIPATLGKLSKLQTLVIESTFVSGEIPASLAQLPLLQQLLLGNNRLGGSIPSNLGATGVLVNLELNDNELSGPIPASLGGAGKNLTSFFAGHNFLTGSIPDSLTLLQLGDLDLSYNLLTGVIPKNLGFALNNFSPGTHRLYLNHNQLTGALNPPSLWEGINEIVLSHNKLTSLGTGSIPNDGTGIGQSIQIFDVHSNLLAGPIPDWALQMNNALYLDLSDNKLTALPPFNGSRLSNGCMNFSVNAITGQIPQGFTLNINLDYLDLHKNQFTGPIPTGFGSGVAQFVHVLDFSYNKLSGHLPSDIFGPAVQALIFNENSLSGPIPPLPPSSNTLTYFDVSNNNFTGSFPASIVTGSPSLQKLKLGNNQFTGPIADFSSACTNLLSFVVENNRFTGPILPPGGVLTACKNLVVYDVSGNLLSGPIPPVITSFTALEVLDVSNNAVTGSVPSFLSNLHALRILDLSNNKLTGGLPLPQLVAGFNALKVAGTASVYIPGLPLYIDSFFFPESTNFERDIQFVFSSTSALDLSGNEISGPIDPSVGQLNGLHFLDLSHNRFSGPIPAAIGQIRDLNALDLSYNMLTGCVPFSLRRFPAADFAGNPGLRGAPLPTKCL